MDVSMLYQTLNVDLSTTFLNQKKLTEIINFINDGDKKLHETICLLINEYYNMNDELRNTLIPYEGKLIESTTTFNIKNFPINLQKILYKLMIFLKGK